MEEMQILYNGEFTNEERKLMTAQMLQELRKGKKLSQKEVAAHLNIPATTYNTYESGRTEPPMEILVRLSFLYEVSVDLIVQRDRTYKTADDVGRQLAEYREQMAGLEKQLAENGTNPPVATELLESLMRLVDAMAEYSQTEAVRKALDKPLKD